MPENWYLARNNQKYGPYPTDQMKEFAASGKLLPTDMVLQDGTGKWASAGTVFFPTATLAAPENQSSPPPLAIPVTQPPSLPPVAPTGQPPPVATPAKPSGESAGSLASNLILGFSVTDVLQTWGKGWKKFTAWFWSRPKAQRWGIVALPFVFIIICSGAMSGHKESGGSDGGGGRGSGSAINVSTPDLYRAYHTNEVSADQKFKGKTVEVNGTVNGVEKDFLDHIYVSLRSGEEFDVFHVECYFGDKHADKIASLSPGQSITVRGTCEGKMAGVKVNDCTLVSK